MLIQQKQTEEVFQSMSGDVWRILDKGSKVGSFVNCLGCPLRYAGETIEDHLNTYFPYLKLLTPSTRDQHSCFPKLGWP